MNNKYTGSKVRNQFTAYLLLRIRGKRRDYLEKRTRINNAETSTDTFNQELQVASLEDVVEQKNKELTLMNEAKGIYLKWENLSDERLLMAIGLLREDERRIIYQHVVEGMNYLEISKVSGLPIHRVKGIYSYAIKKIRNVTRGMKDEF